MSPPAMRAGRDEPSVHTVAGGVRVACAPMAGVQTASVAVFVRAGSAHEERARNGISHVLEHMAFKGTRERDVHRVNLDAERLGAEVNAHTDKDHTAYTMRGLGEHAPQFVAMLADIVRHATFPADELEREREVLLQELAEVEDDPVTVGYHLLDHVCWGTHPAAMPVIGQRRVIERITRDELMSVVAQRYTAPNIVVAAAGAVDAEAIVAAAGSAFAGIAGGPVQALPAPPYVGGTRTRHMDGGQQTHLVMGFPVPARGSDDAVHDVAAAVLGDGMSSPLLAELREKRALVYHAACHVDRFEFGGQMAIEASFAPKHLAAVLREVARLLRQLAEQVGAVDLDRAHNQVAVRLLRQQERPAQCVEDAALDLFALGRVRTAAERVAAVRAVSAAEVRAAIRRLLHAGPSVAVTGSVGRGATPRIGEALAALRG
ncbi:MAG: pitrilysin family protein [Burkholderiaceae bacterium]